MTGRPIVSYRHVTTIISRLSILLLWYHDIDNTVGYIPNIYYCSEVWRSCSPRLNISDHKYSKYSTICKYFNNVFYFNIFQMSFIAVMANLNFQQPLLKSPVSHDLCWFGAQETLLSGFFDKYYQKYLFEIQMFCSIIKCFYGHKTQKCYWPQTFKLVQICLPNFVFIWLFLLGFFS